MQTTLPAAVEAGQGSPEDSVLIGLATIGRLMRQHFHGDAVDPGTFCLLSGLHTHGALRLTDLATLAGLDTSTVSRHLQQLHRDGFIDRTQDPQDGRASLVAISSAGRKLLDEGTERRRALLGKGFQDWDRSDVEVLDRLLARFVANVEKSSAELEHR